jgi:hypothetical protein
MMQPTPVYRFFSKKEYADDLVLNGNMRFAPVSAFATHDDPKYRDEGEKYYYIKQRHDHTKIVEIDGKEHKIEGFGVHSTHRKIEDAWAFCGTTSIVSTARKTYPTYIRNFGLLMRKIEIAIHSKFGEELLVMFGPVAYYNRTMDLASEVPCPPYFSKSETFLSDLEFRIVIIPSDKIYDMGQIEPLTLTIDNPEEVFGETLILNRPVDESD